MSKAGATTGRKPGIGGGSREGARISGWGIPMPLRTRQALEEWAARMGWHPDSVILDEDGYPCSDGESMEGSRCSEALFYAVSSLKAWFGDRPDATVGMRLPVYGGARGHLRVAPPFFVAFGTQLPDDVYCYTVGKNGPPPSFAMEFVSIGKRKRERQLKPDAYARVGVAEYWLFDPHGKFIPGRLKAYRLQDGAYRAIPPLPDGWGYRSAVLGLDIRVANGALRFRDPVAGKDIKELREVWREAADAEAKAAEAEAETRMIQRHTRLAELETRLDRLRTRLAEARAAHLEAQLARLQESGR